MFLGLVALVFSIVLIAELPDGTVEGFRAISRQSEAVQETGVLSGDEVSAAGYVLPKDFFTRDSYPEAIWTYLDRLERTNHDAFACATAGDVIRARMPSGHAPFPKFAGPKVSLSATLLALSIRRRVMQPPVVSTT